MAASKTLLISSQMSLRFLSLTRISLKPTKFSSSSSLFPYRQLSTTSTRNPLQYDMIISRPSRQANNPTRLPGPRPLSSDKERGEEVSFEDWVDKKLTDEEVSGGVGVDKAKRKYYNKRKKRMYGEDSDDERRKVREKSEVVELVPEVVEFRTLHKREEELYFYDAFALPWEKDQHYKMVYQLEKKYFPEYCFDKAFLEPGKSNVKAMGKNTGSEEDKGMVFFEEEKDRKDGVNDLSEKKVVEFFKCLNKVPDKNVDDPFLASRSTGLPSKWDSPAGTVVLVNKPKGVFGYNFWKVAERREKEVVEREVVEGERGCAYHVFSPNIAYNGKTKINHGGATIEY